jgi:hypothetical protein
MNIKPNEFTEGERSLLGRQLQPDTQGRFETLLWKMIETADSTNLKRLSFSFPSHVAAYRNYSYTENWWQELRERATTLTVRFNGS